MAIIFPRSIFLKESHSFVGEGEGEGEICRGSEVFGVQNELKDAKLKINWVLESMVLESMIIKINWYWRIKGTTIGDCSQECGHGQN